MDEICAINVPPPAKAPGYRESLARRSEFVVDDFGDGVAGVRPVEGAGTVRSYLRVHHVADAQTDLGDPQTWEIFRDAPPLKRRTVDPAAYRDDLVARAREIVANQPDRLEAEIVGLALSMLGASEVDEVPELLSAQMPVLFEQFPASSLLYVTVDEVLLARAAFARTQLALQLTPDLPVGPDMDALNAFAAMTLSQGIDFAELLKLPLLALSPAMLGIVIPVLPHAVILCFGFDADLRRPYPTSLASLFRPRVLSDPEGLDRSGLFVQGEAGDGEALVRWWADRLNELFSHIYDPTRWINETGFYNAAAQTAWMVTLERLVADATSLLAEPQASDLQRLQLAFDLLDKAPQLLGYSRRRAHAGFEALLRRDGASRVVRQGLEAHLPRDLANRLGDELDRLFEGLYAHVLDDALTYRRGEKSVKIALKNADELVSTDNSTFVARICRAVRNSSHGLLDTLNSGEDRFLLAAHTGGVPAELPALAPLIALGVLGDPSRLISGEMRKQLSP